MIGACTHVFRRSSAVLTSRGRALRGAARAARSTRVDDGVPCVTLRFSVYGRAPGNPRGTPIHGFIILNLELLALVLHRPHGASRLAWGQGTSRDVSALRRTRNHPRLDAL